MVIGEEVLWFRTRYWAGSTGVHCHAGHWSSKVSHHPVGHGEPHNTRVHIFSTRLSLVITLNLEGPCAQLKTRERKQKRILESFASSGHMSLDSMSLSGHCHLWLSLPSPWLPPPWLPQICAVSPLPILQLRPETSSLSTQPPYPHLQSPPTSQLGISSFSPSSPLPACHPPLPITSFCAIWRVPPPPSQPRLNVFTLPPAAPLYTASRGKQHITQ